MPHGYVESLSGIGLSGWAVDERHPEFPALVSIYLGNELIGVAVAGEYRGDVKDAGRSHDGRCGFRFVFPRAVSPETLPRVAARIDDGPALPATGAAPFEVYDLLFDGSYGRDNSVPTLAFLSMHYLRHNARRLEHLASLHLPLSHTRVVEFGAGAGDHTSFYLDRGCEVLATDARSQNLELLTKRLRQHPAIGRLRTRCVDVEEPFALGECFEVVGPSTGCCIPLLPTRRGRWHAWRRIARRSCCWRPRPIRARVSTPPWERNRPVRCITRSEARTAAPRARGCTPSSSTTCPTSIGRPRSRRTKRSPPRFDNLTSVPDGWPRAILIGSRKPIDSEWLVEAPPQYYAGA